MDAELTNETEGTHTKPRPTLLVSVVVSPVVMGSHVVAADGGITYPEGESANVVRLANIDLVD